MPLFADGIHALLILSELLTAGLLGWFIIQFANWRQRARVLEQRLEISQVCASLAEQAEEEAKRQMGQGI